MKRLTILALFMIQFSVTERLSAQAAGADKKEGNAALQYWQAISQMPVLDQGQQAILERWASAPLDDAAQKLADSSRSSLMYLRRGAQMENCDWGLDYNDGISLLLPHLAKARDLARLAALDARMALKNGNKQVAQDNATAMIALARHLGKDPIIICLLVQYSIEDAAVDLIAPHVLELKAPYEHAVASFEQLPKAATLQQAVRTERDFFGRWMITKLREEENKKPGGGMELWKQMLAGTEPPAELKDVQSVDEIIRMCTELLPKYEELAELVVLPQAEFDQRYPAFQESAKATSPVAEIIFPAINKVLAKQRRSEARMKMLLAAIAVAEGGPEKLQGIQDPFGDGPFEYRALDKGFELTSKLTIDGKPVTLVVGQ